MKYKKGDYVYVKRHDRYIKAQIISDQVYRQKFYKVELIPGSEWLLIDKNNILTKREYNLKFFL